jgi:chaperonin GroEL
MLRIGMEMAGELSSDLCSTCGIDYSDGGISDTGLFIVGSAMQSPFRKIVENAGYSSDEAVKKYVRDCYEVRADYAKNRSGYDIRTMTYHDDLVANGVIDPANVALSTLTNAVSVAALLISTDCMIGINPDSIPPMQIPNA